MKEYVVQSGPLKITVIADCPREAALEAVACWSGRGEGEMPPQRPGGMQPELVVRRRGRRMLRHFSAVRLLALVRGQSVTATWKQLLQRAVAAPN
jgi:hypothetical protein